MLLDALILLIVASCAVDTWFFLTGRSFTGEIFDFIFLTCSNMSPRIFLFSVQQFQFWGCIVISGTISYKKDSRCESLTLTVEIFLAC